MASTEINARNIKALAEVIKDLRQEIYELKAESKKKDNIIAQQTIRLNLIQQKVNVLYAKSMGNGATT